MGINSLWEKPNSCLHVTWTIDYVWQSTLDCVKLKGTFLKLLRGSRKSYSHPTSQENLPAPVQLHGGQSEAYPQLLQYNLILHMHFLSGPNLKLISTK